ncbi:IS110 family transposase [Neomoorella carbonis]|jgi:hypothetical protein|uniref:IS110 family transposase n=1 Tax=Neomoorella carbonis TaxID=3062783 RepID=UPI00324AA79E
MAIGKTLFVGIDIGSDTNVVRILDDTGKDVCGFSVANDLPGVERLVERIVTEAELGWSKNVAVTRRQGCY